MLALREHGEKRSRVNFAIIGRRRIGRFPFLEASFQKLEFIAKADQRRDGAGRDEPHSNTDILFEDLSAERDEGVLDQEPDPINEIGQSHRAVRLPTFISRFELAGLGPEAS